MTPQEMNDEALRRAKEEQDKLTEATLAGADATDKAKAANLKMETATGMAVQQLQKLLDVQLRYTIAMAKGVKGSAAFNDSVDATADVMTTAVNAIGTALAFLLPGGVLVKGLVAGLTFLTTNAIKSAAALQKAANEQGDALDKAYKSMSKSGATASDGMTGLFKDVNRMRLNVMQLDAMASTMANNAKEMTAMGGTVYKARKEYAYLTENMQGFEKGMLMLGMSHEDQAEAIMGFMKMQSNLSQGQQKDYGQLKGAARKYIEETEALTRVTGMNRKEQEAAQEKYMAQQRFGAKVQQLMDEGKVEEANLLQSQMKKYAAKGDQFAQAFADMTTGMITSDAAMKGNMSTQGQMMEEANAITEGRIKTEEEANKSFQNTMVAVKDTTKSFNALYQAGVGEDFLLPFKEGADITKAANQDFAKQIKEAEIEVKKLTATVNTADAQLNRRVDMEIAQNNRMIATQKDLDNKFQDTAIGTGTFMEKLAKAFEPLSKAIGKAVDVFEPLVSGLGDMLIGAISAVIKIMTGDVMGGLKDFKAGWDSAAKGLEDTTKKYIDYQIEMIANFGKNLLKSVEFITGPLGPVFEKAGTAISGFADGIITGVSKFSDMLVDMVKDLYKKLMSLIPDFGAAKEVAGNVAAKGKEYAQTGANVVKNAGDTAVDFVSSIFGGGGKESTAAPAAAPAGGKPAAAAAAAPAGGKPAAAPAAAPAGGKPAAAAPASSSGGFFSSIGDLFGGGGKESTAAPAAPAQNVPAGDSELKKYTSLAANISKFESGKAGYNAYNRGTVGNKTIGSDKPIDFSKMTIDEYLKYGHLKPGDKDRIFAMGKYQIIPQTMEGLVKKLGLDPASTVLDAKTQDLLFTEGLVNQTRTNVAAYLSGKSNNRDAAILDLAKEFASVGVPYPAGKAKERGESYYAGVGGNKAHNSPDQVGAALDADRQNKVSAAMGGVFDGPKSGYAATLHGNEAVIPLKDGAVPVSMSQEFNMTAVNLGELVNQMKYNMAVQDRMITVLEEIRRAQTTTADNTGRMVAYASN
jgi:hypothetical protein